MKSIGKLLSIALVCFYAHLCGEIQAAAYPNRPIEMIIPFDPGTASDLIGRLAAELAQEHLGTKINITNKPGGSGATGYTFIKNSKPNGYIIGLGTTTLVSHKILGKLPFDHHAVEVVLLFQTSPTLLCVPANSPYKTLDDVIKDARERPGEISWATASGNLLTISLGFFQQAGLKFKVVPSGGGGAQPVILATGGHVDMAFSNILEAKAQLDAGLLRPLAVNAPSRMESFPDIPTFQELGYSMPSSAIRGIITPLGVDPEHLKILNNAFRKAIASQKFHDFVANTSGVVLEASFGDAMKLLDEQQAVFEKIAQQ